MKLLDQVVDVIRKRHYSIRTEQAYTDWIKRFIIFKDVIVQFEIEGFSWIKSLNHNSKDAISH